MVELGWGARQALSVAGRGRVVGVYARAAYLDLPGGLVALTAPGVPMGPIHARLASPPDRLRPGDEVLVTPPLLQAGPVLLDLRTARAWRGSALTSEELEAATAVALDVLAAAPASSLPVPAPLDHLRRGDLPALATRLGAVGPGLTPSGDDCLAGILLVARLRWGQAAEGGLVRTATAVETNDIARAFLAWAARGQSIEPVHDLLGGAASADRGRARRALATLCHFGHSSGADLALGLRLGLRLLPSTPWARLATLA